MQQLGTYARLKERDGSADGGGRTAKFAAGAGQTAFVERRDEHFHGIDTVHDITSASVLMR
jgi:hypothetical protein